MVSPLEIDEAGMRIGVAGPSCTVKLMGVQLIMAGTERWTVIRFGAVWIYV